MTQVGDLGLANKVRYVSKNSTNFNKRYVVINGQLFRVPSNFADLFVARKPFKPFLSYLIKDYRTPPIVLEPNGDISVDSFFRYRFGDEIADYLANPLCIGISGGNSKDLSMKSMFPNLFWKEQTKGSVVKGLFTAQDNLKDLANHWLVRKSIQEKWAVFSFAQGMQTLSDGIVAHLEKKYGCAIEFMLNSKVVEAQFESADKVRLKGQQKVPNAEINLEVDHVFSSLPAFELATILNNHHSKLKSSLQSIPTVHMAVLSLFFPQNILPEQFGGFGFLVPSRENSPLLGTTFDSCIFPSRECPGTKMTVCRICFGHGIDCFICFNRLCSEGIDLWIYLVTQIR